MSDIWIISDNHFNHSNILKFTDSKTGKLIRGDRFSSTTEMDEFMIEQWNSRVKPGDKIYNLGDVFFGDRQYFQKLWPKLHGQKRLIVGNHDDIKYLSNGGFFSKVYMWRMFPEFGILLSHVPIHESGLCRGAPEDPDATLLVNVHGHTHQAGSPNGPYISTCVELRNYTPVHIEDLQKEAKEILKSVNISVDTPT